MAHRAPRLLLPSLSSAAVVVLFFSFSSVLVASGAAAECPKPQGGNDTVLTNDALLKNTFPEGTEVGFECANGFEVEGGSSTVTCTGEKWTALDLRCKKKDCGPPKEQPNMRYEIGSGGTLFGQSVRVFCNVGYKLSGTSYKRCYATGWIGKSKCQVITCSALGVISNGRHMWATAADPKFGEVVQYLCDDGYTLHGNAFIVCRENGRYSAPPPECKDAKDVSATMEASTPPNAAPTSPSAEQGGTNTSTTHESVPLRETKSTTHAATSAPPTSVHIRGTTDIPTTEDTRTATSAAATASSDTTGKRREIETNEDSGHTAVIASVIGTTIVVLALLVILRQLLKKRKGSLNGTVDIY